MPSPLNPLPFPLGQAGDGEPCGRITGAKALFCFMEGKTEEEKGRMDELPEDPTGGLDGMTKKKQGMNKGTAIKPSNIIPWKKISAGVKILVISLYQQIS